MSLLKVIFNRANFMSIFPALLLRFTFGMYVYIVFDVMSLLIFKERGLFLIFLYCVQIPNSTFDFNFQSQDCLPNQNDFSCVKNI